MTFSQFAIDGFRSAWLKLHTLKIDLGRQELLEADLKDKLYGDDRFIEAKKLVLGAVRRSNKISQYYGMLAQQGSGGGGVRFNQAIAVSSIVYQLYTARSFQAWLKQVEGLYESNRCDSLVLWTLQGLEVKKPVRLTSRVSLTGLHNLPKFPLRDALLAKINRVEYSLMQGMSPWFPSPSAVLTKWHRQKAVFLRDDEIADVQEEIGGRNDEELEACILGMALSGLTPLLTTRHMAFASTVVPGVGLGSFFADDMYVRIPIRGDIPIDPDDCRKQIRSIRSLRENDWRAFRVGAGRFLRSRLRDPMTEGVAATEWVVADMLIDLGVCAEVILMHNENSGNQEITHKVSQRGSWLLGTSIKDREAYLERFRLLYRARSRAAHGSPPPYCTQDQLKDFVGLCSELLKSVAARGFPDWRKLTIGNLKTAWQR